MYNIYVENNLRSHSHTSSPISTILILHRGRNRPWCSNDVCGASLQLLSRMAPPHSRHRASFAILRIAALAYDFARSDYTSSDAVGSRSSANNLLVDRDYFISDSNRT